MRMAIDIASSAWERRAELLKPAGGPTRALADRTVPGRPLDITPRAAKKRKADAVDGGRAPDTGGLKSRFLLAQMAAGGIDLCQDPSCKSCGKDHRCAVVLAKGGVCLGAHRHTAHNPTAHGQPLQAGGKPVSFKKPVVKRQRK